MGTLDPAIVGNVETLDDLREDGRRRFTKRRTKEELEDIVVAVFRDRDAAKDKTEKQFGSTLQPTAAAFAVPKLQAPVLHRAVIGPMSTPAGESKLSHGKKQSLTTATPSISAHTAAKEFDTDRVDLVGSFGLLQLGTRTHEASSENTGAESDDSETLWFQTQMVKTEDEEDIREKDAGLRSIPSIASEAKIDRIPFMLLVPEQDGGTSHRSIDELPTTVHEELMTRLDTITTACNTRTEAYLRLMRNPALYVDRQFCVCDQVLKNLRVKLGGKERPSQAFLEGGELGVSADDKCIKERMLCLHLVRTEKWGGYVLRLVPLTEEFRIGKRWTDFGFWIRE